MQNDEKKSSILEKLRKLMNLKESATMCGEMGEANAAAAGITRLLREYDLTLADIPVEEKEQEPVDIEEITLHTPYMGFPWYWELLDVIAKYNNASVIRTRKFDARGKVEQTVYRVVGRQKNREIVLFLASFLTHRFIRIGQDAYPSWKYRQFRLTGMTPPSRSVYMKSFLLGCVVGLREKLEAECRADYSERLTALVRTSRAEIDLFLQNMGVSNARKRSVHVLGSAISEGEEVGRNIELQKGLGAMTKDTPVLA